MSVSVSMIARPSAMGVPMVAAGSSVLEDEDPDQVDQEAQDGDDEQPLVLHFRRLHQPLHGLREDEEGDEEQEEAVDEAGQDLRTNIAGGERGETS